MKITLTLLFLFIVNMNAVNCFAIKKAGGRPPALSIESTGSAGNDVVKWFAEEFATPGGPLSRKSLKPKSPKKDSITTYLPLGVISKS